MQLLGIDAGTSSIKASVIDGTNGRLIASTYHPKEEMKVMAPHTGWAEQDPELWWQHTLSAIRNLVNMPGVEGEAIAAIGLSYQMHGLVLIDQAMEVLRPSIIWCDSRAVEIGNQAFKELGPDKCLANLLNSPGNFTASKLRWVIENEPEIFEKTHKMMLPGDFISMKLTGELLTSFSGLSEGILWDFSKNEAPKFLLDHYGIPTSMLPKAVGSFGEQGGLLSSVASELGLRPGIPVAYRAGDQPNNAFSLGVVNPGEIAATAGTSGVVYGVSGEKSYDPASRVNTFVHVNHTQEDPSYGILLCINGTGILNSWLRRNFAGISYDEMNRLAMDVTPGADGLTMMPFGNGAERVLENKEIGGMVHNVNFNIHGQGHLIRAAHEGIVYSFRYGIDIMNKLGLKQEIIRAGMANMFLSPVFREALATVADVKIELFNTDGAQGAARGAGVGIGHFANFDEALSAIKKVGEEEPKPALKEAYDKAYERWQNVLTQVLNQN